jgi:hypothetical protein
MSCCAAAPVADTNCAAQLVLEHKWKQHSAAPTHVLVSMFHVDNAVLSSIASGCFSFCHMYRACRTSTSSRHSLRVSAQAQPSQAAEVASSSSADSSSGQKTFHHGITYVSYEGNCFWVKFNNSGGQHNSRAVYASSSSLMAELQQSHSTGCCCMSCISSAMMVHQRYSSSHYHLQPFAVRTDPSDPCC